MTRKPKATTDAAGVAAATTGTQAPTASPADPAPPSRAPIIAPGPAGAVTEAAAAPRRTKAALLRDLLAAPGGATLGALTAATGWQAHTVRAALSGLRKAGLEITRRRDGKDTIYCIAAAEAASTRGSATVPGVPSLGVSAPGLTMAAGSAGGMADVRPTGGAGTGEDPSRAIDLSSVPGAAE